MFQKLHRWAIPLWLCISVLYTALGAAVWIVGGLNWVGAITPFLGLLSCIVGIWAVVESKRRGR